MPKMKSAALARIAAVTPQQVGEFGGKGFSRGVYWRAGSARSSSGEPDQAPEIARIIKKESGSQLNDAG